MRGRAGYVAEHLRTSFWFVPAYMCLGAVVLSVITLSLDEQQLLTKTWVFNGGPDSALEVLSTIASSMITIAGVVFSITIVAMTLASSQFGPRMLHNFVRNRGNQITLGTFLAGFLYALLVMRALRTSAESVPNISVTVALGFAVAGIAVLIYFIHHIAHDIQAPNLIAKIAKEFEEGVDHLFPHFDDLDKAQPLPEESGDALPDGDGHPLVARGSGYVQLVDLDGLVTKAGEHGLVLRLETRPGRFVVESTQVATVWSAEGAGSWSDEAAKDLAECVVTDTRRAPVQDVEFPVKQLAEVAVRVLSPAINDPFTASTSVNHLGVGLCKMAAQELPSSRLADPDGTLRVVIDDPVTFGRLVGGAYDQIRQAASYHVHVYLHLLEALARVADCVTYDDRLTPLERQAKLTLDHAVTEVAAEADLDVVRDRYDAFEAAIARARTRIATTV